MPRGQMTEQYIRPNTRVTSTRAMTMAELTAITAGRNCSFGIQPSQSLATPEESRKSRVIPSMNTQARTTLNFFSIIL